MAKQISMDEFSKELEKLIPEAQEIFSKKVESSVESMTEESKDIADRYPQHSLQNKLGKEMAEEWTTERTQATDGTKGIFIGNTHKDSYSFETGRGGDLPISPTAQLENKAEDLQDE